MMRSSFQLILSLLPLLLLNGQDSSLPYGVKRLPDGNLDFNGAIVRTAARELALPCRFVLKEGALEVILGKPDGRMHEALLCTDIPAVQVQTMLYLLGVENGFRLPSEKGRQGDLVDLLIEWKDAQGKLQREPVENWIVDTRTGKNLIPQGWVFVGSAVRNGAFQADTEGNIVINYSIGSTILDSPDSGSDDDTLHIVDAGKTQPPSGTAVFLVMKPRKKVASSIIQAPEKGNVSP